MQEAPVHPASGSRRARWRLALRQPSFPRALAIVAVLLFCWPLVRVPRLGLGEAWVHLTVSWAFVIVAILARARALAEPDEGDDA